MENLNNNPAEDAVVETPVVEEAPVVEAPVVEEAPVEPVKEEVKEEPKAEAEEPKVNDAIKTPAYAGTEEVQALGSVSDGVIGATKAPAPTPKKAAKKVDAAKKTVALYSTKNVTWEGVGKVYRGYNIVSEDASEKWLTRSHIRLATPQEVAKEFGK